MVFTTENILLIGSILLFISIVAGKTSYKLGVPTLIFFLIIGMLAGSEGFGGIYFDSPDTAQFIGVIALNLILFSGGLDTRWESVKPVLWKGISLSTLGVFVTAMAIGAFVTAVTELTFLEGMLLGAIVSSTDAAAVFSILRARNIGLKSQLRPTLELESGSNDPMAYFLTISVITLLINPDMEVLQLVPFFFQQMLIGGLMGYIIGKLSLKLINKINLDFEGLYSVLILAVMFFTYSATDALNGNGFLAIYITGIILGNNSFIHKRSIMRFFDGLAWLMEIVMFLTLGLLVFPSQIVPIIGIGLLIAVFQIFIARPLGVLLSLSFFRMPFKQRMFISWVGLRGAVPIVFATYPLIAGVEEADTIFHIVFFIAVTSILLQGTTLSKVADWLKVTEIGKPKKKTPLDIEMSEDIKSELVEIDLPEESYAIGQQIVDLDFPRQALIVMIQRNGKYLTPNGSTVLEPKDRLLVLADSDETFDEVYNKLGID
ncbi:MAG: potassium/proton antiporter [Candidatus Cyclobacteriaceae bacterium M2_1C_046]